MTSTFVPMCDFVAPGSVGKAKVEHFEIDRSPVRGFMRPDEYISPGKYTRLFVGGRLFMSDTDMERRTNYGVVRAARGDVLIAGLGIGMILVPILRKPEVTSVTVVEISKDVADLVEPSMRKLPGAEKLTIVVADIFDRPHLGRQMFDTIYFDIWADQSTDALKEMATLHRRFARRKRPGGWMSSWRLDLLRARREQERRSGW